MNDEDRTPFHTCQYAGCLRRQTHIIRFTKKAGKMKMKAELGMCRAHAIFTYRKHLSEPEEKRRGISCEIWQWDDEASIITGS